MAPRRNVTNIIVSEEFRVNSETILRNFLHDQHATTFEFPNTLTNVERAWLHNYVKTYGLNSKSHGKDTSRKLVISKPNSDRTNANRIPFELNRDSVQMIKNFLLKYPLSKERTDIHNLKTRLKNIDCTDTNMGQLTFGIPQLPIFSLNNELINFRMSLPIWPMREHLMEAIITNQVLIICGETGSGKTTQIPQFILDYSASCSEKARIICTQPRRISAVAVAERVAAERGEKTGQTVGFHIRLESCVGPKTALIYCTNGILLRTLMNGDACLKSFTHIIVDEIHERDRFSDFLLICLRECLVNYPHIRLILMSATIDVNTFRNYFNNAPVIHIPGRLFQVTELYLDDILKSISYQSSAMTELKKKLKAVNSTVANQPAVFNNLVVAKPIPTVNTPNISADLQLEMEECIMECIQDGSEDSFSQLLQLILSDHGPVNFQQPDTGYTGLMAAAMHGNIDICMQLLNYGADIKLRSLNENFSAIDWAYAKENVDVYELLRQYESYSNSDDQQLGECAGAAITDDDKSLLLDLYHRSVSDQYIDFDLLHVLLYNVHMKNDWGSILIFLAGYDDIITVRDRIIADARFNKIPYEIFTLHSLMQITDQHKVFNSLNGKRKIILSTNIAETSITIDDVLYVIDSGKVKERCYDAMTGICSLQSCWISQAAAKQRAGRAGRTQPGICFHLFSKFRYNSMLQFGTAEMLRMPLHELCLQTKMLAPRETKIDDFLSRALEPPSAMAVSNAIKHLQEIDALDEEENLTVLGQHLVDLPVEPRLAKMLIYSVIFKCIDPLLTIVSFLSYRDPFVIPNVPNQKNIAAGMRKQFSLNTFSDHMILLRVFQSWQEAKLSKGERYFCNKYFVSSATMEMIVNIRSQLLAQLRAGGFVKTRPPGDIRDLNENANNWSLIKAILTAGFYPNIAFINRSCLQIRNKKEKKILLNNTSALRTGDRSAANSDHAQCVRAVPTNWLIYEELSRNNNIYTIRSVTCVSALTIALFVDNTTTLTAMPCDSEGTDSDNEMPESTATLHNWIIFEGPTQLLNMIMMLRQKMNMLIMKKISNPYKQYSVHDEALLQLISAVLLKEDQTAGLVQPTGIGQRPKIMTSSNNQDQNGLGYNGGRNRQHRRQITKRDEQIITEVLQFKRISTCHYNKYVPQPLTNIQRQEYSFDDQFQLDLATNMSSLSLYEPNSIQFQEPAMSSFLPLDLNDFQDNGVTVDLEGACAPEPHCEGGYDLPWQLQVRNPDCTAYFVIKTASVKSIDVSISKKSWVFAPQIERKLLKVFQTGRNVLLVFTVTGSRCFQGISRLTSVPSADFNHYSIHCTIEWLSRADIPYEQVHGLDQMSFVDGDELDTSMGVQLWFLFTNYRPQVPVQLEPMVAPTGRAITKLRKM